jgi:hypothetical protein
MRKRAVRLTSQTEDDGGIADLLLELKRLGLDSCVLQAVSPAQ